MCKLFSNYHRELNTVGMDNAYYMQGLGFEFRLLQKKLFSNLRDTKVFNQGKF